MNHADTTIFRVWPGRQPILPIEKVRKLSCRKVYFGDREGEGSLENCGRHIWETPKAKVKNGQGALGGGEEGAFPEWR